MQYALNAKAPTQRLCAQLFRVFRFKYGHKGTAPVSMLLNLNFPSLFALDAKAMGQHPCVQSCGPTLRVVRFNQPLTCMHGPLLGHVPTLQKPPQRLWASALVMELIFAYIQKTLSKLSPIDFFPSNLPLPPLPSLFLLRPCFPFLAPSKPSQVPGPWDRKP